MALEALQDAAEGPQDPWNAYTTAAAGQMAGDTGTKLRSADTKLYYTKVSCALPLICQLTV